MSRYTNTTYTCAFCGTKVNQKIPLSFSTNDQSVDGNQFCDEQFEIIQECPHCNYASLNINNKLKNLTKKDIDDYKKKSIYESFNDKSFNKLIKAAYFYEISGDYKNCANIYKLASWLADREDKRSVSFYTKREASKKLSKYLQELDFMRINDLSEAISLVDLHRQLGNFELGLDMANDLIIIAKNFDNSLINDILVYEKQMLEKRNKQVALLSEIREK